MRRLRRIGVLAAVGLAGAMALAGCGAVDSDNVEPAPARQQAGDEAGEAGEPGADGAPGDGADDSGVGGELVDPRSIIFTGEVVVRVEDVSAAAERASAVATRYGGFVGGDRRVIKQRSAATLTLRVPSENFAAAVNDLGELGEEERREISTEDVTAEVVDLEVQIATARTSVERTRGLLEEAESIADIVAVEEELTARESRLARLEMRQRTLADLTTLSTITVELLDPETEPETEEAETGFLTGLRGGWNAFTTSVTVLVTILGALLPFLVTIGVPVGALIWWTRRRRRTAAGVPAPAPATAAQEGTPTGP